MEQGEAFDLGSHGEAHGVVDRAVTPVELPGELVSGVLRIVDQQVDTIGQLHGRLGDRKAAVGRLLMIWKIRNRSTIEVDAIAVGRADMRDGAAHDGRLTNPAHRWCSSVGDPTWQIIEPHREHRWANHVGEGFPNRDGLLLGSVDRCSGSGAEQRRKERQSLYVIPVEVTDEDARAKRSVARLCRAVPTKTRAEVEHDRFVVGGAHDDAARISAVASEVGPRARRRTTHAEKLNVEWPAQDPTRSLLLAAVTTRSPCRVAERYVTHIRRATLEPGDESLTALRYLRHMSNDPAKAPLPDGLVAVVKHDSATCVQIQPALAELAAAGLLTALYTQDDPHFPAGLAPLDDLDLTVSYHHSIETVPTLLSIRDGAEVARAEGWNRAEWRTLTGIDDLGESLAPFRPGCGSLSVDPSRTDELLVRFSGDGLRSRRVEFASLEDEWEALFDRGWSDGLPVVPPTPARVLRMLQGTSRAPDDIVAIVPPDLVAVTVEKVAVNAVMAGCKPEYLPVVLATVAAACTDQFNMHGLLATTMPVGPVLIVNGPIRRSIGMNSAGNTLGQGNRANSTIGRALQLVVRNVGGGRPQEVDRATHGNPGKVSFCFAEDEEGSPWTPLTAQMGIEAGVDAVTLFPGEGPRCAVDQLSREAESLASSLAACLRTVHHPKLVLGFDAILVCGPEHARVFAEAGWDRERVLSELHSRLQIPGSELERGAAGIAEGVPAHLAGATLPKFRPGGLLLVHAGGGAGLFSAIIAGWANGAIGSTPVSAPIDPWK